MTMLLCRIGWMVHYQGVTDNDPILGGGQYVDEHGTGNEIFNFLPIDAFCFGDAQSPHGGNINLGRIDPHHHDQGFVEHATVFWCARRPDTNATVTIGWYEDATVFSGYDENRARKDVQYRIKASANNAFLLKPQFRIFSVPMAQGGNCGIGQSNVRYLDQEICEDMSRELISYKKTSEKDSSNFIDISDQADTTATNRTGRGYGQSNPECEKKAIEVTKNHYTVMGYSVKSVEALNRGWDLEASKDENTLRIEVKGLSNDTVNITLTPNEYRAFSADQSDGYALFIVTNCTTGEPQKYICEKCGDDWIITHVNTDQKYNIVINEIASASISLVGPV
jgi:hypothetical protein